MALAQSHILGIETSCDETAAAVVSRSGQGKGRILSNIVLSQLQDHAPYGGVVPEIAARAHINHLDRLIAEALKESGVGFGALDGGRERRVRSGRANSFRGLRGFRRRRRTTNRCVCALAAKLMPALQLAARSGKAFEKLRPKLNDQASLRASLVGDTSLTTLPRPKPAPLFHVLDV